MTKPEN